MAQFVNSSSSNNTKSILRRHQNGSNKCLVVHCVSFVLNQMFVIFIVVAPVICLGIKMLTCHLYQTMVMRLSLVEHMLRVLENG